MMGDGSICTVRIDVLSGVSGVYMVEGVVDRCRVWVLRGSNLGLWVICESCEAAFVRDESQRQAHDLLNGRGLVLMAH